METGSHKGPSSDVTAASHNFARTIMRATSFKDGTQPDFAYQVSSEPVFSSWLLVIAAAVVFLSVLGALLWKRFLKRK